MKLFYGYVIAINIVAFIMMGVDKYRACRHRWRIPERVLFLAALLGGSGGATMGMWLFWHKTRHKLFAVGLPVILLLQILLIFLITQWAG